MSPALPLPFASRRIPGTSSSSPQAIALRRKGSAMPSSPLAWGSPQTRGDVSPLAASPWVERQGKYGKRFREAVVEMSARPDLSVENLRRAIACHVAHIGVSGHTDLRCPLAVAGASAEVEDKADRFAVWIAADNRRAAEEIWHRVRGLMQTR